MVALFLRPDADQSDGAWLNEAASATNLFASVDETSLSDTDYMVSSTTDGDKVRLRLSDPAGGVAAPLIVRYRCKRTGTQAANLIGRLYQGTSPGTLIATWTRLGVSDTFTTYTYTLTSAEFASITDFTDLYVEFELSQQSSLKVDLNFAAGVYYDSGTVADATGCLSCVRASTSYAKNSSGTWVSFAPNVLRITDLGLLVEQSRTNSLLNSDTPATHTTASIGTAAYTLWVEGSGSALASAGSATITGAASATQGNPNTFNVTVAGTVTITVTGSLTRFQLEAGTYPSSYIPTTSGPVARAADLITFTGNANTILSALPFSICVDLIASAGSVVGSPNTHIVGQSNAPLVLNNDTHAWSYMGGFFASQATLGSSLTFSGGAKVAVAASTGTSSLVGGGGTVATDTVATGESNMKLMSDSFPPDGTCRRITIWNSKIADPTLQAVTAP